MKGTQLLTLGIFLLLMIAVVYFAKTYYPLYKEPFQTAGVSHTELKALTDAQFNIGNWLAGYNARLQFQPFYEPSISSVRRQFEAISFMSVNNSTTLYQLLIGTNGMPNVDQPNLMALPDCVVPETTREAYATASQWLKNRGFPFMNNTMIWSRVQQPQAWEELYQARKLMRIMTYMDRSWLTQQEFALLLIPPGFPTRLSNFGPAKLAYLRQLAELPSSSTATYIDILDRIISGYGNFGMDLPSVGPKLPFTLGNPYSIFPSPGSPSVPEITSAENWLLQYGYLQTKSEAQTYLNNVTNFLFPGDIYVNDLGKKLEQISLIAQDQYNRQRAQAGQNIPQWMPAGQLRVSLNNNTTNDFPIPAPSTLYDARISSFLSEVRDSQNGQWAPGTENFSRFFWEFFGADLAGRSYTTNMINDRTIVHTVPPIPVASRGRAIRDSRMTLIRAYINANSNFMNWHNANWSAYETRYTAEEAALKAYYESTEPAALQAERQRLLSTTAGIFTQNTCKDILPTGRDKWQELFEFSEKNGDLIAKVTSPASTPEERFAADAILAEVEAARTGATARVRIEGFQSVTNTELVNDLRARSAALYSAFPNYTLRIESLSDVTLIYVGSIPASSIPDMTNSARLCSRFQIVKSTDADLYFRVAQISTDTYKAFILNAGKTVSATTRCHQDLSQGVVDTSPEANIDTKRFTTFLNPSKANNSGVCDDEITSANLLLIPNTARNYLINWIFNRTQRLVEYYYKDAGAATITAKKNAVVKLAPTPTLNFTRKTSLNALAQFFYESLNGMYSMTYIYDISTIGNSVIDVRFDVTVHGDPVAIYNRVEELTKRYEKFTQDNIASSIRDEVRMRYVEKLYELQDEQDRNIRRVFKGLIGRFFYENVGGLPVIRGFTLEPTVISSYIPAKNGGFSLPLKDAPGNISYAPMTSYTMNTVTPLRCTDLAQLRILMEEYRDAIYSDELSARIEKGEPARGQFLQNPGGVTFWVPSGGNSKFTVSGTVTCDGVSPAIEAKAATDAELNALTTSATPFTCSMLYTQGTGWDLSGQLVLKQILASQQLGNNQCAVKWKEMVLDPGTNKPVAGKEGVTRRAILTYKPNSDFWMANNRVLDLSGFAFLPSDTGGECKFDATQYKSPSAFKTAYTGAGLTNNASLCRGVAPDVKFSPFVYRDINTDVVRRAGYAVNAIVQDFRNNIETTRLSRAWNLSTNNVNFTYPTNIPYEATLTTREDRCPVRSCSDTDVLYAIADDINKRDRVDFKLMKVTKAVTANSQQCDLEMQIKESGKDNIIFGLSDDNNKIWFLSPTDKKKYELRVEESTGTDGSVNFCFDRLKITNTASAGQPARLTFSHASRMARPGNWQLDRDFPTSPDLFRCTQLYNINQVQKPNLQGQVTTAYSNVIFVRNDEGTQYFILGLGGGAKYSLGSGPNFGFNGKLSLLKGGGQPRSSSSYDWTEIQGNPNIMRVEGSIMRIYTNVQRPSPTNRTFQIISPGNAILNAITTSGVYAIIPTESSLYFAVKDDRNYFGITVGSSTGWASLQANILRTFQNELFALDGSTLYFVGAGDGKKYTVSVPALNSQGVSDICYDIVKFTNTAAAGQPPSLQFSDPLFRASSFSGITNNLATLQTADTPFQCSQMFTINPVEKPLQGVSYSRVTTQRRAVTIAVDPETCELSVDEVGNDGTAHFIQSTTPDLTTPFQYSTEAINAEGNLTDIKSNLATTNQAVHTAVSGPIARYGTETERLKTIIIGEAAGVSQIQTPPDLLRTPMYGVRFTFLTARNSPRAGISAVFLYKNNALIDMYGATITIDGRPDMSTKALALKPANYMARTSFTPETVVSYTTPWSVTIALERPTLIDSFSFSTGNDTNEDPIAWRVEATFLASAQIEAFQNVAQGRTNWVTVQERGLPTAQSILTQATLPPLSTLVTLDAITDTNKRAVETAYATLGAKFTAYKAAPSSTLEAEITALLTTINQNAYPSRGGYYIAPRQSLLPNVVPQIQAQSPLRPKSAAECESFAWHPETIKRISDNIYNTMNTALFKYVGRNYLQQLTSYAINSETYTFYMKTRILNVGMDGAKQIRNGPTYALKFEQAALCDYKPIPTSFRSTDQPLRTGVRYIRVKPVYGDEAFFLQKSPAQGYTYNWNEANTLATDIGLRLASWNEISQMVGEQGQYCSWSWTSDKRLVFPNYERANQWCGTQRKTVTTHNGYAWRPETDPTFNTMRYNAALYGRKPRVPSLSSSSASARNGWATSDSYIGQFYDTGIERENADRTIFLDSAGRTVRDTTKYNHTLWSKWQLRLSQIAILSADTGQNIALGKVVTASSTQIPDNGAGITRPCSPFKVIDGTYTPRSWKDGFVTDINTLAKWRAGEDEYIEIDLGSEQTIGKVVLFAPWGQEYLRYTVDAFDANRNLVARLGEEAVTGINKVYTLDADTYTPPEASYIPYPALQTALFKHPTDSEVVPNEMVLQRIPDCIQRNVFRVNTFYVIEALCRLFAEEYSKRIPGYMANPIPKIKGRAFLSGIHGFFLDTLTNSLVIQPKYFIVSADLAVTPFEQLSQVPVYYKLYFDPVPSCPPQIMRGISRPGVEQFRYVRLSGFSVSAQSGNTIEIGKLNLLLDGTNIRATQGIFFSGFTMINTDSSVRPSSSSSSPTIASRFTVVVAELIKVPYGTFNNTRWFGHYNSVGPGQTPETCQQLCDSDTEFGGGINTDGSFLTPKGNYQCDQVLMHPTLSWAQGNCWFYGPGYTTGADSSPPAPSTDNAGWIMYVQPRRLRLYRKDTTLYIMDLFNNRILKTPVRGAPAISNLVYNVIQPRAVTILPNGQAYFCTPSNANHKIQQVQVTSGDYSPTANPILYPQYTLSGTSTRISFLNPLAITSNSAGTLLAITDYAAGRVYVGSPTDNILTRYTLAKAALVQIDSTNTVYVTAQGDSTENWGIVVEKLIGNTFTPFVGSTVGTGTGADDGTGTAAKFLGILDMTIDESNTLYIAEDITDYTIVAPIRQYKGRIRSVTPSGVVTTLIPALPFRPESIATYRSGMTLSVFITSAFLRTVYKADISLSAADPSMLFNPDPTTFWTESATGLRSLTLDLGGPVAANQLSLSTTANHLRFPTALTVQVSPDGNTWRTVNTSTTLSITGPQTVTLPFTLKVPEYDNQFQPFPTEVTGRPPTSQMPYGWGGYTAAADSYHQISNATMDTTTIEAPADYYDPIDNSIVNFALSLAGTGSISQNEVTNLSQNGAMISIDRSISKTPPTLFSTDTSSPPRTRFFGLNDSSFKIITRTGTTLFVKDLTYTPRIASQFIAKSIRFTAVQTRLPSNTTYSLGKMGFYHSNSEVVPVTVTGFRKLNYASFASSIQAKQQQLTAAISLPSTSANLAAVAQLQSELNTLIQQRDQGIAGTAQELAAVQSLFSYTNDTGLTLSKTDAPDGFVVEFVLPFFAYGFSFTTSAESVNADPVQWQLDITMPNRPWRTVERMTSIYPTPQERGFQLPIFDFRGDLLLSSLDTDPLQRKTVELNMINNATLLTAIQNRLLQHRGLTQAQLQSSPFTNPVNITDIAISPNNNKIFVTTDAAGSGIVTQYAITYPPVYGDFLARLTAGTIGASSVEVVQSLEPTSIQGPTTVSLGTGAANYPFMRILFLRANDNGPEIQLHKIFLMNGATVQTLSNTNFYLRSGSTVTQNTTNIPNLFSSATVIESSSFVRASSTSGYIGSIFMHCTSTTAIPIKAISFMNGLNGQKRPQSIRIQVSKNGILWETCYNNTNLNISQPRSFATMTSDSNMISQYPFTSTTAANVTFTSPTVTASTATDINTFMKTTYSRVFVPSQRISYFIPYLNIVLYAYLSRSGEYVYHYVNGSTKGTPLLVENHSRFPNFGIDVQTPRTATASSPASLKTIKDLADTNFADNTSPPSNLLTLCQTRWATTTSEPLNIVGAVSDENTNTIYFRVDTDSAPNAKEYVGFTFEPVFWVSNAQFNAATPTIAFMNTYDTPPIPVNLFPVTNGFRMIRFTPTKIRNNTTARINNLILWYFDNTIVPTTSITPNPSIVTSQLNTSQTFTLSTFEANKTFVSNDYTPSFRRIRVLSTLGRSAPGATFVNTQFWNSNSFRSEYFLPSSETQLTVASITVPSFRLAPAGSTKRIRLSFFGRVNFPRLAEVGPTETNMAYNGFYNSDTPKTLQFMITITNTNPMITARSFVKDFTPATIPATSPTRDADIETERQRYIEFPSIPDTFEADIFNGDRITLTVRKNTFIRRRVFSMNNLQYAEDDTYHFGLYTATNIGARLRYEIFDEYVNPPLSAYSFTTNATDTATDPVSWRVEGSRDNVAWSLLDRRTNIPTPVARSCDLPKFFFSFFAIREPEGRDPCYYPITTTLASCGLDCTSSPYYDMMATDLGARRRDTTGANAQFPVDFGTAAKPSNPANIYGVTFNPTNQQCIVDYYPTAQPTQARRAVYQFNPTNLNCTSPPPAGFDTTGKDLTKLFSFSKVRDISAPALGVADANGVITNAIPLGATETFQFIRFVPLKVVSTFSTNIRISKLIFLMPNGSIYTFPTGTTVTSPSNPSNTSAQNVYYTGTQPLTTEWTDTTFGILEYSLPSSISQSQIDSFSIIIGSSIAQAPIQWRLEASTDRVTWKSLHLQLSDYPTPSSTQQSYNRFYFSSSLNSQLYSRSITDPQINKNCASTDILTTVVQAAKSQLKPIYMNPSFYGFDAARNTCYYKQRDNSYVRAILFTDIAARTTVSSVTLVRTLPSGFPEPSIQIPQLTNIDSVSPTDATLLSIVRNRYGTTHPLIITETSKDIATNSIIYTFDRRYCPDTFKLTPYFRLNLPVKPDGTAYTSTEFTRDAIVEPVIDLRPESMKSTTNLAVINRVEMTGSYTENEGRSPLSKTLATYTLTSMPNISQVRLYMRANFVNPPGMGISYYINRNFGVAVAGFNMEFQILNAAGEVVYTWLKQVTNPSSNFMVSYPATPDFVINRQLNAGETFRVIVSRYEVRNDGLQFINELPVDGIGVAVELLGLGSLNIPTPIFTPIPFTNTRFVRVFFNKLRNDFSTTLAIDSFQFFNATALGSNPSFTTVTPISASNPGGSADMTKTTIIDTERQAFIFEFPANAYPNGFGFKTYSGTTNTSTDPIQWVVHTSSDGIAWCKSFEQAQDFPLQNTRGCQQGIFIFNNQAAALGSATEITYSIDGCSEPQKVLGTCSKSCLDTDVVSTLNAEFRKATGIQDTNAYKVLGYGDNAGNNQCTISYLLPEDRAKQSLVNGNEVTLLQEQRATFTIKPTTGLCRNITYTMEQSPSDITIQYTRRNLKTAGKQCDSPDILQMVARLFGGIFFPTAYTFNEANNQCIYRIEEGDPSGTSVASRTLTVNFFTSLVNEIYIRSLKVDSAGVVATPTTDVTTNRVRSPDECIPASITGNEKAISSYMITAVNQLYTARFGTGFYLRIKKYAYDATLKRCIYDLWETQLPPELEEFRRIAVDVNVNYNGDCTPTGTLIAPFRNLTIPTVEVTGLGTATKPYRYLLLEPVETRNPDAPAIKLTKLTFGTATLTPAPPVYTDHPELSDTIVNAEITGNVINEIANGGSSVSQNIVIGSHTPDQRKLPLNTNVEIFLKGVYSEFTTNPINHAAVVDAWGSIWVGSATRTIQYQIWLVGPSGNRQLANKTVTAPSSSPINYPDLPDITAMVSFNANDKLELRVYRSLDRENPNFSRFITISNLTAKITYKKPPLLYWNILNPAGSFISALSTAVLYTGSISSNQSHEITGIVPDGGTGPVVIGSTTFSSLPANYTVRLFFKANFLSYYFELAKYSVKTATFELKFEILNGSTVSYTYNKIWTNPTTNPTAYPATPDFTFTRTMAAGETIRMTGIRTAVNTANTVIGMPWTITDIGVRVEFVDEATAAVLANPNISPYIDAQKKNILIDTRAADKQFTAYSFTTGVEGDSQDCDIVRWKLYASTDTFTWQMIDDRSTARQPVSLERNCNQRVWTIGNTEQPFTRNSCTDPPRTFRDCNKQCTDADMLPTFVSRYYASKRILDSTPIHQSPFNIRKLGYSNDPIKGDQCVVEYDNAVTGEQGRVGFTIIPTLKFCDETAKPFMVEVDESVGYGTTLTAFPATPGESYQHIRFRFTKLRGGTATRGQLSKLFLYTSSPEHLTNFSLTTPGEPTNNSAANLANYNAFDATWESTTGPGTVLINLNTPLNTITGYTFVAGADPTRMPVQWVVEYYSSPTKIWKTLHVQSTDYPRNPIGFQSYPRIAFDGQIPATPIETYYFASTATTRAITVADIISGSTIQAILDAYAQRNIDIDFNPTFYRLDANNTGTYILTSGLILSVDISINSAGTSVVRSITHNPIGISAPTIAFPTTVFRLLSSGTNPCIPSGNPCLDSNVLAAVRGRYNSTTLGPATSSPQSYLFTFIGYAYEPSTNMCIYELDPPTKPSVLEGVTTLGFIFERTASTTTCTYRIRAPPVRDPMRTNPLLRQIPYAADKTFKFRKIRFIPTKTRGGGSKVSVGKFSFFSRDAEAFTVKEGFQTYVSPSSTIFDDSLGYSRCRPGWAGFTSTTSSGLSTDSRLAGRQFSFKNERLTTTTVKVCIQCLSNGDYCPTMDTSFANRDCWPGHYCPNPTTIIACPPNTYNPNTRQTSISACIANPQNSLPNARGQNSFDCIAGYYRTGSTCTACGPGTYSSTRGATSSSTCLACPPGINCPSGSTGFRCPSGSYASGSSCIRCPQGTYSPNEGLTSSADCIPCPTNSQNCSEGSSTFSCNQGFYKNGAVCTPCPPDSQLCAAGSTSFICNAGFYNNSSQCTPCQAGTYNPGGTAVTSCTTNPPNSSSQERATIFTCNAGFYRNGAQCTACPTGTSRSTPGATSLSECIRCQPGFFNNTQSATTCQPCPAGTFCASEGTVTPTPCPEGVYCPPKSAAAGTANPQVAGPHTFTATSRDIAGTTATDITETTGYNIANFYITADPNQPWTSDSLQPVMFNFPQPATLVGFSFTTSARSADEDPIQWRIQGSVDGTYWFDVEVQATDYATSTTRSCDQPRIFFDFENTPNQPRDACASGPVAGFQDYRRQTRKQTTSPLKEGFGRMATPSASSLTSQFKPLLKQPVPEQPAGPVETQRSIETYEDKPAEAKPTQHKFLRFRPLKTRSASHPMVQVASFSIETPAGPLKPSRVRATNPMGTWKGDTTELIGGGATGWTDQHKSALIFAFREPLILTGFRFTTGSEPAADPVRWKLEVSTNGTYWETLVDQSKSDFRVPTARGATVSIRL